MVKIIAIANQKGGVGKTTTSVNLAASLAHLHYKTLLVDVDPQGNATSGLGINKNEIEMSIYDVLINNESISDTIQVTTYDNLTLVPANIALAGAEIELVSAISRELRLKRALDEIKENYDYIIIDCPPSLGLITINALTAAQSVLIPVQSEYYALEGLGQLLNTITIVQKHLNDKLKIEGVLLTMADQRTNLSAQVAQEVRQYFDKKVYQTVIDRSVRLSEAPSFGEPILYYSSSSRGAKQYMDLAKEVVAHG